MKGDSEKLWHLRKLIQEFEELDKQIPVKFESDIFEIIKRVVEKKENIKEFLIEHDR